MPEPLDVNYDLSKAKTVVPLIADGHLCRLRLTNLSVDTTDKGPSTKWEWDIVEPVPSTEGEQIRPGDFGAKFFENIQLYAKPDAKNPAWFVERIAKRVDGLLGTGDANNKKGKPTRPSIVVNDAGIRELAPQLVGKEIVAKMKVKTGDYLGNEIQTVTFPGDISA
jgi:hypothetical protein